MKGAIAMTKHTMLGVVVLALLALAGTSAYAQGFGGVCPYGGSGTGYCTGQGPGFGAGFAQGWQGRLDAVEDPALAGQIAALHEEIRAKQWALRNAPLGADTAALEQEIAALRTQLRAANVSAGLCTGTGPTAYGPRGYGMGRGACRDAGAGMGQGNRRGMGNGRGMGYGRGMGRGAGCRYAW
jgi:hypothetical protein